MTKSSVMVKSFFSFFFFLGGDRGGEVGWRGNRVLGLNSLRVLSLLKLYSEGEMIVRICPIEKESSGLS